MKVGKIISLGSVFVGMNPNRRIETNHVIVEINVGISFMKPGKRGTYNYNFVFGFKFIITN